MLKVLDYLFPALIIIVLLPTIYLTFLNRSQETRINIYSSILFGLIAIFTFILLGLKETYINDSFLTNSAILGKQSESSHFLKTLTPPENHELRLDYNGELFQYLILKKIREAQEGKSTIFNSMGTEYKPYPLKDREDISLEEINNNRFLSAELKKGMSFSLPSKSHIKLFSRSTNSTFGGLPEHSVVFEKKSYFYITILIQPTSGPQNGNNTYFYKISMDAKFERLTAGNSRTADYKKWIQETFNYVKENLIE